MAGGAEWTIWMVWIMLSAGLLLVTAGLWHSSARFIHWKRLQASGEDELVWGDLALQVGQTASLTSRFYEEVDSAKDAQSARVTAVGRRSLMLRLDGEPSIPAAQRRERPAWLLPGRTLAVTVTSDTALYKFECRIRDVRLQDTTWVVTAIRPLWLSRTQRRRHVRAEMDLPATFEYTVPPGADSATSARSLLPRHGTLRNLSAGGLCADLDCGASANRAAELIAQYAPDTLLRVRLPIPTLSDTPLLMRVCACQRVIVRCGIGVRLTGVFLPMPSWEEDLLVQRVFQAQREQLKTVVSGQ